MIFLNCNKKSDTLKDFIIDTKTRVTSLKNLDSVVKAALKKKLIIILAKIKYIMLNSFYLKK